MSQSGPIIDYNYTVVRSEVVQCQSSLINDADIELVVPTTAQ